MVTHIFSGAGNLPDGCTDSMLPGNSHADELREIHWTLVEPEVERQARIDLLTLCQLPVGAVHDEYLDWRCDEDGECTPAEFVAMLERINTETWQNACERIYRADFAECEC